MSKGLKCYLCKRSAVRTFIFDLALPGIECRTCGTYAIAPDVVGILSEDTRQRPCWRVREATDAGDTLVITPDNYQRLSDVSIPPVPAKLSRLLQDLGRKSDGAGHWVALDWFQTLASLKCTVTEWAFLRDALVKRELVAVHKADQNKFQVTAMGWEALAPTGGAGVPGDCFVAMSFDSQLNEAYDIGIRPAVEEDCGLKAIRLDREAHNERITDRILAGIRSAQVVVADVTGHRPNVYYEAGFAEALGRIVIRTCRANNFKEVAFDTNQFSHILWETAADLRKNLAARLKRTVRVQLTF